MFPVVKSVGPSLLAIFLSICALDTLVPTLNMEFLMQALVVATSTSQTLILLMP